MCGTDLEVGGLACYKSWSNPPFMLTYLYQVKNSVVVSSKLRVLFFFKQEYYGKHYFILHCVNMNEPLLN